MLAAFAAGSPTPTADQLGVRLGVSAQEVRAAMAPLLRDGILVEPDDEHGYLPAGSPEQLPLERVFALVRGPG